MVLYVYMFQLSVGDLAGVSKATTCRVVKCVTREIALLARDKAAFPTSVEARALAMHQLYEVAHFPAVLGAIDCTHVPIQSPGGENAELYRNRKGFFSLNVQCVCNAKLAFINVVSRWYGSAHDSTIFLNTRLHARFESKEIPSGYLLGDAGYACKPYLLTPLAAPTTLAGERYNSSQIRTRNTVERAFGVLKRRFPCLKMGLRVKVCIYFN